MNRNSQDENTAIKRLDSLELSSRATGILVNAFVKKKKPIQFRAKGNSMFPIIKDGDRVMVSPYENVLPQLGDIVAFIDSSSEKLIVHRVMNVSNNGFITKGDNCFRDDPPQPFDNILGFVSKINDSYNILCGINYIANKNCITFFSKLGLIAIIGRTLTRLTNLISRG